MLMTKSEKPIFCAWGVSKPAAYALKRIGITRPEQLKNLTDQDLLCLNGIGPGQIKRLRAIPM